MRTINQYLFKLSLLSVVLFSSCKNGEKFSNQEKLQYTKMGNIVVKKTFDTLRHSLQRTIVEMGLEKAVPYCQANAYPLTDSYASDSVLVRRTALKYRNPANKPDTAEDRILNFFVAQKEKGVANDSLKSITEKSKDGIIHFYKPILLQPMCVSCHGDKTGAGQSALWKTMDSLYPSDKAYGFKAGDLRGMWHIKFTKN